MTIPGSAHKAYLFAAEKHEGQVRQTETGTEPYVRHCVRVAEKVAAQGLPKQAVEAALLHDTVEDTDATLEEIETLFGVDVRRLVEQLTDVYTPQAYPDLNRAVRKKLEAERFRDCNETVRAIKLADIEDNDKTITSKGRGFVEIWRKEKAYLLAILG